MSGERITRDCPACGTGIDVPANVMGGLVIEAWDDEHRDCAPGDALTDGETT